eukprot:TRINITY_DN68281_c0_g1_i1.p1 TRINITY_DN68281_c0_g1~~TRINITY_DN68281_c0_g1_i1.p1  ORF type:complete len:376 (+),score=49.96 TRINITY_DN68281_c0_g1_i1:29-1129(+)
MVTDVPELLPVPIARRDRRHHVDRRSLLQCCRRASCFAITGTLILSTAAFTVITGTSKWSFRRREPCSAVSRHASEKLEKSGKKQDWHLQVGHAIDVLRTDVPMILNSIDGVGGPAPDFSIFSPDVAFVDARAPDFVLQGLPMYKRFISVVRWSARSMYEESKLDITSLRQPINNELYIRWRLNLWPKGVLSYAKEIFAPSWSPHHTRVPGEDAPLVVEGYSRYEFDPWSAEIVKHTIDITNPPLFIADLLRQHIPSDMQGRPSPGLSVPHMLRPPARASTLAGSALARTARARTAAAALAREGAGWLPQTCDDDFECNEGKANFPLRCCELPLLGKFCCEPPDDDFEPYSRDPAWLHLPVPVDAP